jgi:hypothetical protein
MSEAATILRGFRSIVKLRGVPVTYARGELAATIRMVPGRNARVILADYGVLVGERRNRDWLIEAAMLKLGGEVVIPDRGDEIVMDGKTYQVIGDQGSPHWHYSDPYDQILRIHSVEVVSAG